MRPFFYILLCCFGTFLTLGGQSAATNPFELVPLLSASEQRAVAEAELEAAAATPLPENPFELLPPEPGTASSAQTVDPVEEEVQESRPADTVPEYSNLLLFILLGTLLLLTTLFTLLRTTVYRVFEGLVNENILGQHFRSRKSSGAGAYFAWYFFAILSIGTFVFLAWLHNDVPLLHTAFVSWLICVGGVALLLLAKHAFLFTYGRVFPIYKITSYYNFVIMVFGIALGVLLVPVNALFAWGPDGLQNSMFYTGLAIIGLTYLFRTLRSLVLFAQTISSHPLHFLLYICAVEITPVLVVIKLIFRDLAP